MMITAAETIPAAHSLKSKAQIQQKGFYGLSQKILSYHSINTHCSKACRDNAKVLCETADEVKVAQFPVNVVLSVTRHT